MQNPPSCSSFAKKSPVIRFRPCFGKISAIFQRDRKWIETRHSQVRVLPPQPASPISVSQHVNAARNGAAQRHNAASIARFRPRRPGHISGMPIWRLAARLQDRVTGSKAAVLGIARWHSARTPTGARREPRGGCPGQCSRSGRERENDRAATRAGDVLLGAGRHLVDARPAQRQTLHHSIPRRSRVTSHQPWTRAAPCSVGDSAT